ncbi:MAG: hypothetical protein ACRDUV_17770 [Pseudonocardiaceae bacterium]
MTSVARRVAWPLWLLAAPAFVAVWSGWVGLGRLCGFGVVQPLPGIWDGLHLDTSITLPIGMEAYAVYALRIWLGGDCPGRVVNFARRSTIAALSLGAFGQVVFHLLSAAGVSRAPWPVTALVAVLPVLVLGMGATLAHLVQQANPRHEQRGSATTPHRHMPSKTQAALPVPARGVTGERREPVKGQPAATAGETAERVAALVRTDPHITTAAIAHRLGVSERTARRHRATALQQLDQEREQLENAAKEEGAAA